MRVENLEASNRERVFTHSNEENAELASKQVRDFLLHVLGAEGCSISYWPEEGVQLVAEIKSKWREGVQWVNIFKGSQEQGKFLDWKLPRDPGQTGSTQSRLKG